MQVYEKYQQLARDASSSGDRIAAENLLQHAEHYYRLMVAAGMRANENRDGDGEGGRDNGDRRYDGRSDDRGYDTPYQQQPTPHGAESRDAGDPDDEDGDDRAFDANTGGANDGPSRQRRDVPNDGNGVEPQGERESTERQSGGSESSERPPRRRRARRPQNDESGDLPVVAVEPTQV